MERHPARVFVDRVVDLIGFADSIVGAVHDPEKPKVTMLEQLACPWCGATVAVAIFTLDNPDTGEAVGWTVHSDKCEHRILLAHLWSQARVKAQDESST